MPLELNLLRKQARALERLSMHAAFDACGMCLQAAAHDHAPTETKHILASLDVGFPFLIVSGLPLAERFYNSASALGAG